MLERMKTATNVESAGMARAGDEIIVSSREASDPRHTGTVLEVLTTGGVVHYRVRWHDGADCILFPGPDMHFVHPRSR
jgi:hypothetical protein